MRLRRLVVGSLVAVTVSLTLASPASAHPLGDFTTNVYSGLRVGPDRILVDHVVDLAEVPTFRAMSSIDADRDGTTTAAEADAYATDVCDAQRGALTLTVDGAASPLQVASASLALFDGQAGLQTARIECALETAVERLGTVDFRDASYPGRVGWREVVVAGDQATITDSDVPAVSISDRLGAYPQDRLQSPLAQTGATFTATPGGDALAASPVGALPDVPGLDWASETFTDLVDRRALTVPFAAFALVVAMVLGAFHAIAPGHGKTVMAAYIVGQHGTVAQALGLGATVAVTHTAGVLALGIALSTTATFAPEALYPWLGLGSGLLVVAIGGMLLVRAVRNRSTPFLGHQHGHGPGQHTHHWDVADLLPAATEAPVAELAHAGGTSALPGGAPSVDHGRHDHDHDHDHTESHGHDHHDHVHSDDHDRHPARMGRGGVLLMGLAGGLVPSPSALVVLLGAIAIGRAWFGVVVIAAYGVGMAATLVAAGLLMARMRDRITAFVSRSHPGLAGSLRYLPMGTAGLVLLGGVVLSGRALGSL